MKKRVYRNRQQAYPKTQPRLNEQRGLMNTNSHEDEEYDSEEESDLDLKELNSKDEAINSI